MRLIVTGSQSFIGSALRRAARERGIEWRGLDLAPSADPDETTCDINAPDLAAKLGPADALVHLAAVSRDADCRRDPAAAVRVNIAGTLNVLEAARRAGIGHILFASTEWVYGDTGPEPVDEDTPIDANRIAGEYALTKLAGERLLAMGAGPGGPRVTTLRFGIVYGPREDRTTWSAVESLAAAVREQGRVELKGSSGTARRFIHVDDVARGLLAAANAPAAVSPVYNLTGDSLIRLGDVIAAAGRLRGNQPELVEGDPRLASIRNASNARARGELAWRPEIDLEKGLETLWTW